MDRLELTISQKGYFRDTVECTCTVMTHGSVMDHLELTISQKGYFRDTVYRDDPWKCHGSLRTYYFPERLFSGHSVP